MRHLLPTRYFWIVEGLILVTGVILINLALRYGMGVDFGFWGVAFWLGVGLVLGWVKST